MARPAVAPPLPPPVVPPLAGEDGAKLREALRRGAPIFQELRRCVEASGEPCEGNILYTWNSWQIEPEMEAKRRNIFALAAALPLDAAGGGDGQDGKRPVRILEVGFNAGHSVCLMLLANPRAQVVAFDLCEHAYTHPCAEALRRHFGPERLELHAGPSGEAMPAHRSEFLRRHPEAETGAGGQLAPGQGFDLLHVDGGHQFAVALGDLENCWRLAHAGGALSLVLLDDTDINGVAAAWSDFVAAGRAVERRLPYALGRYQHAVGELLPPAWGGGGSSCAACGACGAPLICGGCRDVRYCCEAHAREHWPVHRTVCAARRPPPLRFLSSAELPSLCPSLRAGPEGELLASRDLAAGEELFSEVPLAWQPEAASRLSLCAACGSRVAPSAAASAAAAAIERCQGCGQVVFCTSCRGAKCKMCPELKISSGRVGAGTLLALDLVRRLHARELPEATFPPPAVASPAWRAASRGAVEGVQKVGHWCSAVRWSDDEAAEVVAAMEPGRVELGAKGQRVAVGYFPKFARLRVASAPAFMAGGGGGGNVQIDIRPSPGHHFTLRAALKRAVRAGDAVSLAG